MSISPWSAKVAARPCSETVHRAREARSGRDGAQRSTPIRLAVLRDPDSVDKSTHSFSGRTRARNFKVDRPRRREEEDPAKQPDRLPQADVPGDRGATDVGGDVERVQSHQAELD
jgi:hypothetical protein